MVKKLLILFISVLVGTLLAFFAVLLFQDYVVPFGCLVILVIGAGWIIWIARGGLKKKSQEHRKT